MTSTTDDRFGGTFAPNAYLVACKFVLVLSSLVYFMASTTFNVISNIYRSPSFLGLFLEGCMVLLIEDCMVPLIEGCVVLGCMVLLIEGCVVLLIEGCMVLLIEGCVLIEGCMVPFFEGYFEREYNTESSKEWILKQNQQFQILKI